MFGHDWEDVILAQRSRRLAQFLRIGVSMSDVGNAMSLREPCEQIERANPLAGCERVGEFFIEDGDV
jgi:hypothetical protein